MSRRTLALLVVLTATAVAGFFDIERVNEIRLTFAQPNWDEILDSLYAAGEEGRLIGSAAINGVQFESVGVRYKGGSSYNPGRRKNPLNIKLDDVLAGQMIDGHGTLRLANVFNDPSFVREVLSYEIARRYMPASMSNFANIYVNDTLIGLYTNNEDVDRAFMRVAFYCDENARLKGRLTENSQMIGWKYLGQDSTAYFDYFGLESDSGWSELVDFLDTLNNHNEALARVLNIDQHLWMLAFDALLVNLDAPINMPQNHYLYRDASARFNPIVWDLNESFGVFRDLEGVGILTVAQMQQLDPFLRSTDTNYPIASRVLGSSRYRRMYVAHMKTMIDEVFADGWYEERAYDIQDIIDADVLADPNKFYTYNDFLNNVTRSVGSGPLAVVGLTELMDARAGYVLSNPEFQATAPVVSDVTHAPANPGPNTSVLFTATVADADSVMLGYRQVPATRFDWAVMYDDGVHGDGSAGDGVYGVSVQIGAGDCQHYVYAENPNAATFCPARAEREYFTLPVTGAVVINELMASNASTVPDPNGQYDDWFELYNNSGASVSLDGYLVSDDSANPYQWEMPDVTVPAHGYVTVWADNDAGQPGLHANFRLSESGEMLVLTDPDGETQDRVVFGPQTTDVSFGRFPNGTGPFVFMDPTFGYENVGGVGVADRCEVAAVRLLEGAFPNPFAGSTAVRFTLPAAGHLTLRVFDAAGRLAAVLADGRQTEGRHEVRFEGGAGRTTGGIYFVQLRVETDAGEHATETLKLVAAR